MHCKGPPLLEALQVVTAAGGTVCGGQAIIVLAAVQTIDIGDETVVLDERESGTAANTQAAGHARAQGVHAEVIATSTHKTCSPSHAHTLTRGTLTLFWVAARVFNRQRQREGSSRSELLPSSLCRASSATGCCSPRLPERLIRHVDALQSLPAAIDLLLSSLALRSLCPRQLGWCGCVEGVGCWVLSRTGSGYGEPIENRCLRECLPRDELEVGG